jgi:hypothetical protein
MFFRSFSKYSRVGVVAPPRSIAAYPIVAMCIGYAIVLFSRAVLNDADTYWHIETGMWMLEHHALPSGDPFSYTFAGAPWTTHEWLSEVLMALAYRAGAWDGIVVLFGVAAATTCGLLARYLARWLNQPAATAVFVFGIACCGPSLLARPHLLALAALTAWTIGLVSAKDDDTAPWLLLPLMTVWANLHGSFIFGLALTLPIAFEAVIEAGPRRAFIARRWGTFLVAAIAASLVTPNGWHGLSLPFQLMRLTTNASVMEWAPTNFQSFPPLEGALMALLYVAFSRNVRLPIDRLIIVLGLLYLGLAHTRHQMLAGIVGAIVLAKPLGQAFHGADGEVNRGKESCADRRARTLIFAGVAFMVLLTVVRLTHPIERTDDRVSPVTALDHVPPDIRTEPVFNSYDFGGYLIFKHVKPFIDGRALPYGDDYISAYLAAVAPNQAEFARIVEKYRIRWALLAAGSPAAKMISALPDWRRLYVDGVAAVYVREAPTKQPDRESPHEDGPSDSIAKMESTQSAPDGRENQ